MPIITVKLDARIRRSFRVEQVAGMFDVPLEERVRHELTAEVPGLDEPWTIGAIVGPSGSGKTTLAKAAFGNAVCRPKAWPKDRAIIDVLGESGLGLEGRAREAGDGTSTHSVGARVPTTELSIKVLTWWLTAVGLGSPPTWLKPYRVLSTGERFRADVVRAVMEGAGKLTPRRKGAEGITDFSGALAAALAEDWLVVIDEFTSSLDRTVAKTTSSALARLLRLQAQGTGDGRGKLRFVAVTCHHDILPWLSPDWTVELGAARAAGSGDPRRTRLGPQKPCFAKQSTATRQAERHGGRSLQRAAITARLIREKPQRPRVQFTVDRVPQAMWERFGEHHYLSGGLAASATCYAAWWEGEAPGDKLRRRKVGGSLALPWRGEPIAFCAVVAALGWRGVKRIQRLVTLPEFQGIGIGGQLLDAVAALEAERGFRVTITASHPAIIAHCTRSQRWEYCGMKKNGSTPQRMEGREIRSSVGRAVAAFEFVGK